MPIVLRVWRELPPLRIIENVDAGLSHASLVLEFDRGTQVLMEIVGFWTPEYLASKRQTLRHFRERRILIALPERSVREDAAVGDNVILYKTALKLQPVLEALERCRTTGERLR